MRRFLTGVVLASLLIACSAHAVEGGKSLYLLGKRGPLAGLIPKPGWYFTDDIYYYTGGRDGLLPISGSVDNNIKADGNYIPLLDLICFGALLLPLFFSGGGRI